MIEAAELTLEQQATNYQTMLHIARVQALLMRVMKLLMDRAEAHDRSKLAPPEVDIFTEFTPKLKGTTYGSPEYREFTAQMKPALAHHYANNSHHPEHFPWHCPVCRRQFTNEQHASAPEGPNDTGDKYCPECCGPSVIYEGQLMFKPELGVNGMSLLDLVEMFCDWKAASERHADGDICRSISINAERHGLSPQLAQILRNSVAELFG